MPTGDGEVALGACDGLPGPAQCQQQRCLGRVGEGPARVGARGLADALGPDGCVPQELGGPHRAPRLRQPLGGWLGLHGPFGTLPCPAPPWPVLRGDGHINGAGGGSRGGRPQPIHCPWCWPRGIGGDGGAGLRGLRQLLQLPIGHCKGTVGTLGDTPPGLRELCFHPEDRGHVETHKVGDQVAAGHCIGLFMSLTRMGTHETLQDRRDHRAAGHSMGLLRPLEERGTGETFVRPWRPWRC